jgi:hypothetical protein
MNVPDFHVPKGWLPIVTDAIKESAGFPETWLFEITGSKQSGGALLLEAAYHSPDILVGSKEPHPFKAFVDLRERARARSLETCEICGKTGRLCDEKTNARVRCEEHLGIRSTAV